ncbi:hypothetical protein CERZMDRAFT_48948 [Cercospora zeae-maydis SCOH1-5]|uniref:Uncharacterized protein n=1 Tax=Cercospora zeae-maydis SCOH1-5 TaxID=717836 RepID=A0A6A6F7Q0_9PEZI|nr:hypothetical protein CERZMDRAFT_48948 [Cercospora zeae-maydis SCOH1-5]
MDDWQDAALTNRHLHNRVGKQGRGKGGKSNGAFDVHKTFGTYEVKCPAAGKLGPDKDSQHSGVGRLEIYNLNEQGNALLGELVLEAALHGTVIMAGSRRVMKVVIRGLEKDEQEDGGSDDQGKNDVEMNDEDVRERQRHQQFEKNSFRSPKFWLKWQGEILHGASPSGGEERSVLTTDSGYLVFTGNNCDKFQGTLNCQLLEWNNVKLSGWKLKNQPARDFDVQWTV